MRLAPLALLVVVLATGAAAQAPALVRALDDGSGEGPAYRFDPTALTVAPGATFRVENAGQDAHTLTHDAPELLFHTGALEAGDGRDVTAPTAEGDYPFKCVFHGGMRGTLRVATQAATTTPPEADAPLAAWLAPAALAGVALFRRRA